MRNTKMALESYNPKAEDILLFDTNILIKLLYPVDFNGSVEKYAELYSQIKRVRARLIVSSIQISEFINRCIRLQFALYQEKSSVKLDFKKDYRSTDDYRDSMNTILDIVTSDIKLNFAFIDDGFSKMQQEDIFKYGFSYDFNDSLLVEIAKLYNAIVVTDDIDFGNYKADFRIITSNQWLLAFK